MLLPENFVNRLDAELPNEAAALIQKKLARATACKCTSESQ